MKAFLLTQFALFILVFVQGQSISATYTSGLIPTNFNTYDNSCNGPSATLTITLPAGESYTVSSVDVSYAMTGFGSGWKSHQRSLIKLQNTNVEETTEAVGVGDITGTQTYARSISIANGNYAGGTELVFQMKARRTQEGNPGCNNLINRVDNNSWTITVNYASTTNKPKLGVNTSTPTQTMEVAGKLKLGDDLNTPEAGTIRWNAINKDFEGYNGTAWLSLTKNDGGNWGKANINENQQYTPVDGAPNDQFGSAVAISGDVALIGSYLKKVGAYTNQGKVYVYRRSGNTWVQNGMLLAPDGFTGDFFGKSVAISGDYAIVGAYGKDVGANGKQGKVYIYKWNGSAWINEAGLVAFDGAAEDFFGNAVAISNDYAVVGAVGKNVGANTDQGKMYIFKRTGSTWALDFHFTTADGAGGDRFGCSVAISGDYVVVGAKQKEGGANMDQGKAYVYKRTGSTWAFQSGIVASEGAANDFFGESVSISGDYLIVGAIGAGNLSQGKAYVFKRNNNTWLEQAALASSDGAENDNFGFAVSISGDYVVVGASSKSGGNNISQGKVYIFYRTGNAWAEQAGLVASDGANDQFGYAVSIHGDHIVIGAPFKTVKSNVQQGKVYFFSK